MRLKVYCASECLHIASVILSQTNSIFSVWLSHYKIFTCLLSTFNRWNTNGHSSAHSKYQLPPAGLKKQGNELVGPVGDSVTNCLVGFHLAAWLVVGTMGYNFKFFKNE